MKTVLDVISIAGFIAVSVLCLIAVKFGSEWAMKMMDTVVPMVITCWITNFTTIVNYHYGTSASSELKTRIMAATSQSKERTRQSEHLRFEKAIERARAKKGDECIELTDEVKKP